MRIVQIGFHDTAGSAFFLAHALNKVTKHKAVNLRFVDDYARWPCMIEAGDLSKDAVRRILLKADVVHFHIYVNPFFSSLRLKPSDFEDKKTLVYYHGTMLREHSEELNAIARELLPNHIPTVSTVDLTRHVKDAVWLPVCRPFKEMKEKYGLSLVDEKATRSFCRRRDVTFGHATSSVKKHQSHVFFQALTNIIRGSKGVRAKTIINSSWDSCMRKMSRFDVALGNAGPVPGYGCTTVEASVFSLPCLCLLTPEVNALFKKYAGSIPPVISWRDAANLEEKLYDLFQGRRDRQVLGEALHDWMQRFHDEKAVADRYLKIISGR